MMVLDFIVVFGFAELVALTGTIGALARPRTGGPLLRLAGPQSDRRTRPASDPRDLRPRVAHVSREVA